MDKIKYPGRNLSLRKSLVLYVVVFVLIALTLSVLTFALCDNAVQQIRASYPSSGEKYYLTNEQGEQLGDGVLIGSTPVITSERDRFALALLEALPTLAATGCSVLCILAAALLFYRNKLKKPIAELMVASEKISNNDLDFSIEYNSKDELGQLCSSFELMRSTLASNFSAMWRQVEERKRLNAAFAHDLRTPLTVLKGQSEMLGEYAPQMSEDKIISTAETMRHHIIRLESYISTMNDLQRLEDIAIKKELVSIKEIEKQMCSTGKTVCTDKEFIFRQNILNAQNVTVDISVLMQVYENLLSNALRYADSKIIVSIEESDGLLILTIADDGEGFTAKDLLNATNPYYKAKNETNDEHFGIGLNICKILCEKHGGYLQISNENGAKVVAAFKE